MSLAHIGQSLVTIQRGFNNKLKTAGNINCGFSTSDIIFDLNLRNADEKHIY
jgi:hypothetical protein